MPSPRSADPPADFGRTHRDFVILVWLTDGPDGWDARGAAYTGDRGELWDFTVPGTPLWTRPYGGLIAGTWSGMRNPPLIT